MFSDLFKFSSRTLRGNGVLLLWVQKAVNKREQEKTTWKEQCREVSQLPRWTLFFFMKIVNHSSWRGFFAFPPNVRRHESSENCQKRCSPFPLWIYILCRMLLRKYQSQERLGAQWTKVGQYVQLGVNVFLAYHTLKFFFCQSELESHIYQKTLSDTS